MGRRKISIQQITDPKLRLVHIFPSITFPLLISLLFSLTTLSVVFIFQIISFASFCSISKEEEFPNGFVDNFPQEKKGIDKKGC